MQDFFDKFEKTQFADTYMAKSYILPILREYSAPQHNNTSEGRYLVPALRGLYEKFCSTYDKSASGSGLDKLDVSNEVSLLRQYEKDEAPTHFINNTLKFVWGILYKCCNVEASTSPQIRLGKGTR